MGERVRCQHCGAANLLQALLRAVLVVDERGDEGTAAECWDRQACRDRRKRNAALASNQSAA